MKGCRFIGSRNHGRSRSSRATGNHSGGSSDRSDGSERTRNGSGRTSSKSSRTPPNRRNGANRGAGSSRSGIDGCRPYVTRATRSSRTGTCSRTRTINGTRWAVTTSSCSRASNQRSSRIPDTGGTRNSGQEATRSTVDGSQSRFSDTRKGGSCEGNDKATRVDGSTYRREGIWVGSDGRSRGSRYRSWN